MASLPAAAVLATALLALAAPVGSKNILMIASDDMRPELSMYGHKYMYNPNLQALADEGYTFRRNYVQQALCSPSRTVLLTGRRPDTSHVWTIGPYFRDTTGKNWTTLPEFFKHEGFTAAGAGKIYHTGGPSGLIINKTTHKIIRHGDDYPASWSLPYIQESDSYNHWGNHTAHPKGAPLSNAGIDAPVNTFNDAKNALAMIATMKNLTKADPSKPFFIACGFHRPHIPYVHPKEFEQYYPNASVQYPPNPGFEITEDVPPMAPHDWTGEGNTYGDLHDLGIQDNMPCRSEGGRKVCSREYNWTSMCSSIPYWKGHEMKRAYYSCISYVDHLVGMLVGTLKDLGIYEDTTIIFWGDHGYKLGEHCDWFKHDNYEDAVRIPTIIKPAKGLLPSNAKPAGSMIEEMTEEIDIFPSLVDLHGFAVPTYLQGKSWVPLLLQDAAPTKTMVFSQYPHSLVPNVGRKPVEDSMPVMGYSMRTDEWRYTEWAYFPCGRFLDDPMKCPNSSTPMWNEVYGVELYDHRGDPSNSFGVYENVNLAYQPDHAATVKALSATLHANWPAVPPI